MAAIRAKTNLRAGDVVVNTHPIEIATVVGSGVAVCVTNGAGTGGVAHYLLPSYTGSGTETTKFGNIALNQLFDKLAGAGASTSSLEAKLFGGSGNSSARSQLGTSNLELAREFLAKKGVRIVGEDVGGSGGRMLKYSPADGTAEVRKLQWPQPSTRTYKGDANLLISQLNSVGWPSVQRLANIRPPSGQA